MKIPIFYNRKLFKELNSIPLDKDEWLRKCKPETIIRAKEIAKILLMENIKEIHSLGCGNGLLEYHLLKLIPDLKLTCSDRDFDYVYNLWSVFPNSNAEVFDILKGTFKETTYLLNRLDADFSDREWRKIFKRLKQANAKVIFIPCSFLNWKVFGTQFWNLFYNELSGKTMDFMGWTRTQKSLEKLWRGIYNYKETFKYDNINDIYLLK